MAKYHVEHVEHSGKVCMSYETEHDDLDALLERLHEAVGHGMGAGFNLWEGDQLVYQYRH